MGIVYVHIMFDLNLISILDLFIKKKELQSCPEGNLIIVWNLIETGALHNNNVYLLM